jgi:Fic family protein
MIDAGGPAVVNYIHQRKDWPSFRWDWAAVHQPLAAARYRQGILFGKVESLGFALRNDTVLETLTEEVQKSSEIEGERLDREQVRSSLAQRLGIDVGAVAPVDRQVDGFVAMIVDATQQCDTPLTAERLCGWHAAMFPTGYSGMFRIKVGAWRDDSKGPMQVVSGPIGHERVHYEAPVAPRLDTEMGAFLRWFETPIKLDGVVKAALAHLWFVTIHPFDDGNGRIARAVAEMALARSEQTTMRLYSMSSQIRKELKQYYDTLEWTQKGNLEVTEWMVWFLGCLERAIEGAEHELEAVRAKARFWSTLRDTTINERQRRMLNRLLDGFDGKLTTRKWSQLAKCSHDTALRDILDLMSKGILVQDAAGRSTSYSLVPS